MDNNVDVTTGLPTLPDGYWWRVNRGMVRDDYVSMYSESYRYREVGFVCVMHNQPVVTKKRFHKPVTTIEPTAYRRERIQTQLFNDGLRCLSTGESIFTKEPAGYNYDITPKTIREAADRIMVAWATSDKRAAAKRAEDALLGDYPPKRLRQYNE